MKKIAFVLFASTLGIWSGICLFFNFVVALNVFAWFPSLTETVPTGMEVLSEENATRLAGEFISHLFPTYFFLQIGLGISASIFGAIIWGNVGKRSRIAIALSILTAVLVIVHTSTLYRHVHSKRIERYQAVDQGDEEAAAILKDEFMQIHTISLLWDIATSLGVTIGLIIFLSGIDFPTNNSRSTKE